MQLPAGRFLSKTHIARLNQLGTPWHVGRCISSSWAHHQGRLHSLIRPRQIDLAVYNLRADSWWSVTRPKHYLFMRWLIASAGGAAVLWPMMVMVLGLSPQDQQARPKVVIVTVATLGPATFVALSSNSSHQDLCWLWPRTLLCSLCSLEHRPPPLAQGLCASAEPCCCC